jgi:hypothetical protein
MIDVELKKPLTVKTDEATKSTHLMFPLPQLDDVRRVLDQNGIAYSLARDAIQLHKGKPFIAIIEFGRGANAAKIQAALDAA